MATVAKAGRYEIVGELGRGAMGVVYKATDPVIGRTVAVKTIRLSAEGTGLSGPELLVRFQTEARAAGLLAHPNIVVVFDAGEEDGLYFITMELVEGKSLQALLDSGQAFPLPRVLRIMEQTCNALNFAHERNVVHRDIKPANLMLTADDTVKITDFGTAKILQFGTVQQTAHVMGTPSYMSPEQVKGRPVDGRSDIFSLGVMLYEMITGEKPFPGQNITTVIYKIVNEEPVPPRQIDPSIHPGISAVILKALTKDPDYRYQTCREMLEDLKNFRAIAANGASLQSTMIQGNPAATVAMQNNSGNGAGYDDPRLLFATARSIGGNAAHPDQTPAVRRTGPVAPFEEPKKKSMVGTILATLVLLGVIGYGGFKLRPIFMEARDLRAAQQKTAAGNNSAPTAAEPSTAVPPDSSASSQENTEVTTSSIATPTPMVPATVSTVAPKIKVEAAVVPKKLETSLTTRAAEYKGRIEQAVAEKGLAGHVKVQGSGNTLTLAGKLRPAEHSTLLQFLRDTPTDIHVVDHIEYDDAPTGTLAPLDGGHPVPGSGYGALHVVTDVIGATALLHGANGRVVEQCTTPCSFNDLNPSRYSLEVKKDGYLPVQTALQVKVGSVQDQKIKLESVAKGILVRSQPPGADVFINGDKQSGQTPLTLPLAPGQYNLVLRLAGHEPFSGKIQVKENIQTQLNAQLNEKSNSHVQMLDNRVPKP
ncbi:MAG TPA: serine/threonine-protein kinase [Candidatus Saccharimonadales bacterium]|nr:serine/threonine-protein kinase [Candidatus Saccharimonadales bacterium]